MGLEQLYNEASAQSYVGMVRDKQSSDAPVEEQLVNYMDGTARTRPNNESDEFQTEFRRNLPGSFKTGGSQPPATTNNKSYPLSRWTDRALRLAFEGRGVGPATLRDGFYTERFRTDTAGRLIHNYTPRSGERLIDKNMSAKLRNNTSPSGAPVGTSGI